MASKKRGASASPRRRSAAEMQKWYNQHKSELQAFEQANDAVKQLRDVTRNSTMNVNSVDKETVVGYLQNPSAYESQLRNTSWYLLSRSGAYQLIISFFATMLCLDARTVIPDYDPTATPNDQQMLKSWSDTVKLLSTWNLQNEFKKVMVYCLVQDVFYGIPYFDDGLFILPLPADYCRIVGQYPDGSYEFAFNFQYFTGQREQYIQLWGEPFVSLQNEDQGTGNWKIIPQEYSACWKYNEPYDLILPVFSGIFSSLIDLLDISDIQAVAARQEIYKLLYIKLTTLKNMPDDFAIDPKTVVQYANKLIEEALPDYATFAIVPGNQDLGVIDFSSSNKAAESNKVVDATKNVMQGAGVSHVLGPNISGTSAYKNAMISNTETGLKILPAIEGWVNRMLGNQLSDAAKVKFFHVSRYTRDDFRKELLEDAQYSEPTKLALLSLNGIDPVQALSLNRLENDILNLGEKFNQPLTSSFTSSNSSQTGQGAPTKSDTDLTDEGQKSRER